MDLSLVSMRVCEENGTEILCLWRRIFARYQRLWRLSCCCNVRIVFAHRDFGNPRSTNQLTRQPCLAVSIIHVSVRILDKYSYDIRADLLSQYSDVVQFRQRSQRELFLNEKVALCTSTVAWAIPNQDVLCDAQVVPGSCAMVPQNDGRRVCFFFHLSLSWNWQHLCQSPVFCIHLYPGAFAFTWWHYFFEDSISVVRVEKLGIILPLDLQGDVMTAPCALCRCVILSKSMCRTSVVRDTSVKYQT